jgi:hypothetical protein
MVIGQHVLICRITPQSVNIRTSFFVGQPVLSVNVPLDKMGHLTTLRRTKPTSPLNHIKVAKKESFMMTKNKDIQRFCKQWIEKEPVGNEVSLFYEGATGYFESTAYFQNWNVIENEKQLFAES